MAHKEIMIVSVFIRWLKPGATFEGFVREWEADCGTAIRLSAGLALKSLAR